MNQITRIILEKIVEAITAILSLNEGAALGNTKSDAPTLSPRVTDPVPDPVPDPETPAPPSPPETPSPDLVPEPKPTPAPDSKPTPAPDPKPQETPAMKAGVEVDAEGIPWDARIHSGAKTKLVKKNTWKLLRGVDPVLVAQVKTELTIKMEAANGAPPAAAPDPITPPAPPATSATPDTPATSDTPPPKLTWPMLLRKIGEASLDGDIVNAACNKFGVADIGSLQDQDALVPLVATELGVG